MLVKFPGQTDRRDVEATCQTHDLAPTAGALLDLAEPADHWQGHDLTALVDRDPPGPDPDPDRPAEEGGGDPPAGWRGHAYVTTNQIPGGSTYRAVRGDRRKAVTVTDPSWEHDTLKFYVGRRFFSKPRQAFELGPGFGEERRVPIDDSFEALFDRLDEHVGTNRRLRDQLTERRRELSEEKRRQLEEMGYL